MNLENNLEKNHQILPEREKVQKTIGRALHTSGPRVQGGKGCSVCSSKKD